MDELNKYGEIFSSIYDKSYWSDFSHEFGQKIAKFYSGLDVSKQEKSILDLCCGSGKVAHYLLSKGYWVVGIDKSAAMINLARKNTEDFIDRAVFIVDEATTFNLDQKFGMVISTFDSINHLPDLASVESCFAQVKKVLVNDGLFLFDVNTSKGLQEWEFVDYDEGESYSFVIHGKFDEDKQRAYSRVIGFSRLKDNLWERFEEIMYNSSFKISSLLDLLKKVGFLKFEIYHPRTFMSINSDPEELSRVFIVAFVSN